MPQTTQHIENRGAVENSSTSQNVDGQQIVAYGRNPDGSLLQRTFANQNNAAIWASMQVPGNAGSIERVHIANQNAPLF